MIAFFVHSIMMMGVMLSSFYAFFKSIKYTVIIRQKVVTVSWCLLWAVLYGLGPFLMPSLLMFLFACLASIAFVFFLTRLKFETVVSAYLLSFGISYVFNYISIIPVSIIFALLADSETVVDAPLDFSQPIYILIYSIIAVLQLVFAVLFFRIKRFKNGFTFIFKKYTIVVSLIVTGIIVIFVAWIGTMAKSDEKVYAIYLFVAGVLIAGAGIYLLIYKLVKNYQKMRIRQHSENQFEKMYLESQEEIKRLKKLNEELEKAKSSALHSINRKIRAMQEAVEKGNATLEDINNLKNAWQGELERFSETKRLQSTNVKGIDILFDSYENQFTQNDIVFEIVLDGNIKYMVDNVINQNQFETLITNHLDDAYIAVNASDNTYRRITAMIRFVNDCYEFTVLDGGIPFEIDTLVRLGTERVTTHADTGGSGIGFETTFEIMQEYNASLIINEQEESGIDFSKSVTIRFDGKSQYIIETYRPGDFPASERYVIMGR